MVVQRGTYLVNTVRADIAPVTNTDFVFKVTSGVVTATTLSSYLDSLETQFGQLSNKLDTVEASINAHKANTSNPHNVNKSQVGLSNVDNTSDIDKPVSTATQNALDLKANNSALQAHVTNTNNPHSVTKAQVGLSNVTNDAQVRRDELAVAGGVATLDTQGKLVSSQIPAMALTEVFVIDSEAEQLALVAQIGDVAIRTDIRQTFILKEMPPSTLSNWIQFATPSSDVNSVNGQTGTVVLDKTDIGLNNVDNTSDIDKPVSTAVQNALDLKADTSALSAHESRVDNPHNVTKEQIGLGNVSNLSDADRPISTATQNALNLKADQTDLQAHIDDKSNPHSVTKAQVGLSNVDNTSDIDKPISTATQTALDTKLVKTDIKAGNNITVEVNPSTNEVTVNSTVKGGSSPWGANTNYGLNETVTYNELFWTCLVNHTSDTTFDFSKWKVIGLNFKPWKPNYDKYLEGIHYVSHNSCVYVCKESHVSGTQFDASKWDLLGGAFTDSELFYNATNSMTTITLSRAANESGLSIYRNGLKLAPNAYTLSSDGKTVTFVNPIPANTVVEAVTESPHLFQPYVTPITISGTTDVNTTVIDLGMKVDYKSQIITWIVDNTSPDPRTWELSSDGTQMMLTNMLPSGTNYTAIVLKNIVVGENTTPIPIESNGLGQVVVLDTSNVSTSIKLPSSGTWFYWGIGFNKNGSMTTESLCGVDVGGTVIYNGSADVKYFRGFAWRVK